MNCGQNKYGKAARLAGANPDVPVGIVETIVDAVEDAIREDEQRVSDAVSMEANSLLGTMNPMWH